MSRNTLINSIIGRDSGSGSSLVREILKLDRYLSIPLVYTPSNEDNFDLLELCE